MIFSPRPYQEEALQALHRHVCEKTTNPCVVIPTGGGKSALMAWAIQRWKAEYPPFRVGIFAHRKELVLQNANELHGFMPGADIGINAAGLGRRDFHKDIIYGMIDSCYKRSGEFTPFDAIFVDECFPAGTVVSTPRGDAPIENLGVGQTVHTSMGVGKIEVTSARNTRKLVELELKNGTVIRCTPNHPFFTESGWTKAETLAVGSYLFSKKDMQVLRSYFQAVDEAETRRNNSGPQLFERKKLEQAKVLFGLLHEEGRKSDAETERSKESQQNAQGYWSQTEATRRKWQADSSASTTLKENRGRLENGTCCGDIATMPQGDAETLQDRCCRSDKKDSDRVGWRLSQHAEEPGRGQEKDTVFATARVESVTFIECEIDVPVYNLQVSGHPSYFADGILVHNCHRLPPSGEGKYRQFIQGCQRWNPNLKVVGWTATPFRMGCGAICHKDHILNEICYEAKITDLIRDGFLCPIRSKVGVSQPGLEDVRRNSGGDYILKSLASATNDDRVVHEAVAEAMRIINAEQRKSVMFFCVDVEHCKKVHDALRMWNLFAPMVTGKTKASKREQIAKDFKDGRYRAICNINVYTEGFNAKNVDCIVLLRPTLSAGLFAQMVGRGLRLHPAKTSCLVLDFGGCIEEHGPIDLLGNQVTITAVCKECREAFSRALRVCPACGWEIPKREAERLETAEKEKRLHSMKASKRSILSTQPETYAVNTICVSRHVKPGAPDSLRVQYRCGMSMYNEWVCLDHPDFIGRKAQKWWRARLGVTKSLPTVDSALEDMFLTQSILDWTKTITVRKNGRYYEVVGYNQPVTEDVTV